jgi:hypothetical protein
MRIFSLKRHSMLGQIWRLYIVLGTITVAGLLLISWEIVQLRQITRDGLFRTRAAQAYSLQLESEVNKIAYFNTQYWLFKREATKLIAESLWKQRIIPYQDSLKNLIYAIQDERLIEKMNTIREDISRLETIWRKGLAKEVHLDKIEKEFDIQIEKVHKSIGNLFLDKEVAFQNGSNALNQVREWIFYTVLVLTLLIIFIGGATIIVIYNRIFGEVEKVNIQLLEYSQGSLAKVKKPQTEELFPIAEASEKLGGVFTRLKNLAIEVGLGKFDVDIRPFGGKGEIGNEVTKMRLSLKQIVFETQERNWFNEGFALIGEILRVSSRDSDFYEILVGELVRYLNVTQGGVFAYNSQKDVWK